MDYFREDKVPLLESDNYQYQHPLFKSIKKSTKLYSQLSKELFDDQPYTFLFHRYNLSLVSTKYGGSISTPYGIFTYRNMF